MPNKSTGYDGKFISVSLDSIKELHTEIKTILTILDLPPVSFPSKGFLSKATVMDILQLYPIQVMSINGGAEYKCIGGVQQLQLANYILAGETEIPVVHHKGRVKLLQLQRKFLVEVCMMPAILGIYNVHSKSILKRVWQKSQDLPKEITSELYLGNIEALAAMLGVSERTLYRNEA